MLLDGMVGIISVGVVTSRHRCASVGRCRLSASRLWRCLHVSAMGPVVMATRNMARCSQEGRSASSHPCVQCAKGGCEKREITWVKGRQALLRALDCAETHRERTAYRSIVGGGGYDEEVPGTVTTAATGLWQPRVQIDAAWGFFTVGLSCHWRAGLRLS